MNKAGVEKAKAEAERFIALAQEVFDADKDGQHGEYGYWASKKTGALRRASMDLTRALAEMRKV